MPKEKKQIAVGGQAVIEGVMMRGPAHIATAVRRKDGTIEVKKEKFESITKKRKILGWPLIRGFVSLIEMMIIGFSSLTFSADRASLDLEEEEKKTKKNPRGKDSAAGEKKPTGFFEKLGSAVSFLVAIVIGVALFMLLPYRIASWLGFGKANISFNLIAGAIRIVFFLLYLMLIRLMKDIRRVFEYHGAEHKSVFAYENNDKLLPENIQRYLTFHPRCGTSFLFFVFLLSILVFSVVDALIALKLGAPPVYWVRLLSHLPFIPLVSGISYEVLKATGKHMNNPLVKFFIAPGLGLQRITTIQPDDSQVEVAVVALKAALELDLADTPVVWVKDEKEKELEELKKA